MSKKFAAACVGAMWLVACEGSSESASKHDAAVSAPQQKREEPAPPRAEHAADGGGNVLDAGRDAGAPPAADGGKPAHVEPPDASQHALPDAGNVVEEDAGPAAPRCHAGVKVRASGSPTVWLVIDGSGSMIDSFGSVSRWDAMREVLVNPNDGLVKSLQSELRWGLVLFDGPPSGGATTNIAVLPDGGTLQFPSPPATTCPRTQEVEPQLNNFAALQAALPELPLGGTTPTDKALEHLLQRYPAAPESTDGPVSVVLATDGAPNDFCSESFLPPDVRPYVVNAVRKLFERGITTYTLSLAFTDQSLMQHLTDVAAAGGTGKPVFTPADKDALASALREIVGKNVDCSVRLNKCVSLSHACDGAVALDGKAVPCDDHNGFSLHDEATLQLNGEACARYRASKSRKIDLDYPCDTVSR